MSDLFDEIKEHVSLDFPVRHRGITVTRDNKILCPYHEEKTPSFSLDLKTGYGHCFGCGKNADVIDLEYHLGGHSSMYDAATRLNELCNLGLKSNGYDKEKANEAQDALEVLRLYCEEANRLLLENEAALLWLKEKKGITLENVKEYLFGFIPERGLPDKTILKNNRDQFRKLNILERIEGGYREKFKGCLILPVWQNRKTVSIQTRKFSEHPNFKSKWLNLENGEIITHKSVAFPENLNRKECIVTEAITDAVAFKNAGYPATALLGTTVGQDSHCFEKAKAKLYFCLDPDEAGRKANFELARKYKGWILDLGYSIDPDEVSVELGQLQFKALVNEKMEKAQFYLDAVIEKEDVPEALNEIAILPTATERERYLKKVSEKRDIGISALKKDLKPLMQEAEDRPPTELIICDPKPILHPAMSLMNGELLYGNFNQTKPYFICNREIIEPAELEKKFVIRDKPQQLRFSAKAINEYREGREANRQKLFDDICNLLDRYLVFPYAWHIPMIAFWIIATYLHRAFPLFPYLWIQSPTKRCGKTRLLELIDALAFNGGGLQTAPTQAVLYRQPAITGGTLCWDEAENLHKGKEGGERIEVINMAHRNGGIVQRCEGEDNKVKSFEVFRPIAIAGIETIHDTVQDRSIKIELARKRTTQKVNRLQIDRIKRELQNLRDELHIFALERTPAIMDVYNNFPNEIILNSADDRLRDALEVVYAVTEGMGISYPPALLEAGKELSENRKGEEEEQTFIRAISILKEELTNRAREEVVLTSQEAWLLFQQGGIEDLKEKKEAQALLRRLKFRSDTHHVLGVQIRGYKVDLKNIEDFEKRYAIDTHNSQNDTQNDTH